MDTCTGRPVGAPPIAVSQTSVAFPIPVPHASYWLNKGDAADLLRMGVVRVINACNVFWQPKVKGLKVGTDQNNTTGNKFFLIQKCWLLAFTEAL